VQKNFAVNEYFVKATTQPPLFHTGSRRARARRPLAQPANASLRLGPPRQRRRSRASRVSSPRQPVPALALSLERGQNRQGDRLLAAGVPRVCFGAGRASCTHLSRPIRTETGGGDATLVVVPVLLVVVALVVVVVVVVFTFQGLASAPAKHPALTYLDLSGLKLEEARIVLV